MAVKFRVATAADIAKITAIEQFFQAWWADAHTQMFRNRSDATFFVSFSDVDGSILAYMLGLNRGAGVGEIAIARTNPTIFSKNPDGSIVRDVDGDPVLSPVAQDAMIRAFGALNRYLKAHGITKVVFDVPQKMLSLITTAIADVRYGAAALINVNVSSTTIVDGRHIELTLL